MVGAGHQARLPARLPMAAALARAMVADKACRLFPMKTDGDDEMNDHLSCILLQPPSRFSSPPAYLRLVYSFKRHKLFHLPTAVDRTCPLIMFNKPISFFIHELIDENPHVLLISLFSCHKLILLFIFLSSN